MPPRTLRFLLVLLLSAAPLAAQAVPDGRVTAGTLAFDGHATAGDFTGTTSVVAGALRGAPSLEGVTGWVEAPVASLRTGNDRRDRDLNKSMESATYPAIRFDLDGVVPGEVRGDTTEVTLRGRFTIHGVERPAEFPARIERTAEGVRLLAELPMNLKDYRIGGLSKFLGIFRMRERIEVRVDVAFAFAAE